MGHHFSVARNGIGGVGSMNTQLYPQKVDLSVYMHNWGFRIYQSHYKAPPMVSSSSRIYKAIDTGDSSVGV